MDALMDDLDLCNHVWEETEVSCEDCGSHPALRCSRCDDVIDLIYDADPREESRAL